MKSKGVQLSPDQTAYICPLCADTEASDYYELEGYSIVTRTCEKCSIQKLEPKSEQKSFREIMDSDIDRMNEWLKKNKIKSREDL